MKTFKKFLESCKAINEAEYNKEWWDSKSDSFKKRYIERHPNSIYAQKTNLSNKQKKDITKFVDKSFGKNSKAAKTTRDNLSDNSTKNTQRKPIKIGSKEQDKYLGMSMSKSPNVLEKLRKAAEKMEANDSISYLDDIADSEYASKDTLISIANTLLNMNADDPRMSPRQEDSWSKDGYSPLRSLVSLADSLADNKTLPLEYRRKMRGFSERMLNKVRAYNSASQEEKDKKSNTKYNNTKASLSKKLGSKKYQQIEDFISDYDVEQYSKAATEYAYDVADGPDDVENHFDDFDDIYYINGSELARNIKKKFGFDIPHYDLENILNKVGGQNVVQWETDGSEKSVSKKPSTPKFGPTASKFHL